MQNNTNISDNCSSNDDESYSSADDSEVRDGDDDDDLSMIEHLTSGFERMEEANIDDDVANGKFVIAGHETMVFQDSENNMDCPSTGKQSSSEETSQASKTGKEQKSKRRPSIGHEFTATIQKLRVLLWIFLGGIMVVSTSGIYIFSIMKESSVFQTEFIGHAAKMIDFFQTDAQRKMEALDSLSALFTIYAIDHNSTWPNVTVTHSAQILERYLNVAGATALQILPIVPKDQRKEWQEYASKNSGWIDEALEETMFQFLGTEASVTSDHKEDENHDHRQIKAKRIVPFIQDDTGMDKTDGPWAVTWQYAPISPDPSIINYNHFTSPDFVEETVSVLEQQFATMSKIHTFSHGWDDQTHLEQFMGNHLHKNLGFDEDAHEPFVYIYYPVFETIKHNSSTVAILSATLYWKRYFEDVLPDGVNGMICVVKNTVGQAFTYRMDGPKATLLGLKDLHDPNYDYIVQEGSYVNHFEKTEESNVHASVHLDDKFLSYTLRVYPSTTFEDQYKTATPLVVSFAMAMLFVLTAVVFKAYDWIVGRRQNAILAKATKTDDIVASLFPETVRARILGDSDKPATFKKAFHSNTSGGQSVSSGRSISTKRSAYDADGVIADLYPESTVLFTDIKGFTAWCSEREPSQVFILLETLYNTYDLIAKKRKVFKVETIGDCYMAVTGVPEPRADHAVVMCKFAHECLSKMSGLLSGLEVALGPGTADLSMRFGIHSGPVTAGVIRSQNARFQLFGDTVNTASRMESTGEAGRIHLSQETADQLINHGKKHWLSARKDKIVAKGKGELQTYWLSRLVSDDDNRSSSTPSVQSAPSELQEMSPTAAASAVVVSTMELEEKADKEKASVDAKLARLVDWNVDVLNRLLGVVVARRAKGGKKSPPNDLVLHSYGPMVIDQMQEAQLPTFDPADTDPIEPAELDSMVIDQLYDYVHAITKLYQDHPFHCYEHASHVAMSVLKLLGRIILPSDIQPDDARNAFSDPLTQFTCVLTALVHDVGHSGVPNVQLAQEKSHLAKYYNGQSIAEQNSIDTAWALLMKPEFASLRGAIYCDQEEMERFRYILVTGVMATDIADGKLKAMRNLRWQRAFACPATLSDSPEVIGSRKAVIVIESLMQASDLAHTMQHWFVYRKWNELYFQECVAAYEAGRSSTNPALGWYQGELSFFNNCVIPLAKQLKECQVFGVSSEEYLNYAIKNRDQWQSSGKELVSEMVANLK